MPPPVTSLERLNLFSTLIKTSPNHHLRASEFILDANLPQWTRLVFSPLGTESFHSSGPLGFRRRKGANIKVFPKQQYLTDLDQFRKLGSALARHTGQDEGEKVDHLVKRVSNKKKIVQ